MSTTPDSRFNMSGDPRFDAAKKSKKKVAATEVPEAEGSEAVSALSGEVDPVKAAKDKKKSKMRRQAEKYAAALKSRGVIYVSKVPPFMKPNKMRNLFEPYGEVTRLYLAEEDASTRKKRQMNGGNASKQFKEGWVEFADKKIAKSVAESLNNTQISRKKGDFYHDDTWNLKYLSGFKWDYLTEKFAYERRTRETKLNATLAQSKKANADFVQLIERQQVEKMIEGRKRAANDGSGDEGEEGAVEEGSSSSKKRRMRDSADGSGDGDRKNRRNFHQARVLGVTHDDVAATLAAER